MSELFSILSRLDVGGIVDIFLVALIFYWLLTLIQGTQAVQLLRGILILSVLAIIVASAFDTLTAFSWLIDKTLPALLVAIPVIFQPELRRALERVGRTGGIFVSARQNTQIEQAIEAVSQAAVALSKVQHGALILLERETGLQDHIETGVRIEAVVTADILLTIFFPGTTLHDGSVIIRGDRIVAAAAVLPLSRNISGSKQLLGTRHRAALGISEMTDAIAVVVSEETGLISVAHNGQLIRGLDKKRLEHLLQAFFRTQLETDLPGRFGLGFSLLKRLKQFRTNKSVIQPQSQSQSQTKR